MATALDPQLELVMCSLCFEVYNDTDKIPKGLPCFHTFCLGCLETFVRNKVEFQLSCPLCQAKFIVPQNGVSDLPTNFMVRQLLDNMSTQNLGTAASTEKNISCYIHLKKKCDFICKTCTLPLCDDCMVTLRKGPHADHDLGKVPDVIVELTQELEDMKKRFEDGENECRHTLEGIANKLKQDKTKTMRDIDIRADEAIAEVIHWKDNTLKIAMKSYEDSENKLFKTKQQLQLKNERIMKNMKQMEQHLEMSDFQRANQQLVSLNDDMKTLSQIPSIDTISFGSLLDKKEINLGVFSPHPVTIDIEGMYYFFHCILLVSLYCIVLPIRSMLLVMQLMHVQIDVYFINYN